ncbi:MAG: hypothetical protein VB853_07480, partial [Pirellulales bacterium]
MVAISYHSHRCARGFCFVLWSMAVAVAAAGADEIRNRVDAHLAVGEFATALRVAEGADAVPRDALLQRIAAAQNRAG